LLKLRYAVLGLLPLVLIGFTQSMPTVGSLSPRANPATPIARAMIPATVAVHNSPLLPSPVAPSTSAVPVSVRYSYYPIRGMSNSELRSQMSRQGPLDKLEGRRYDANTTWVVKWSYGYKSVGHRCAIASVSTRVNVTYTLPQWQPPPSTPRSLIAEWNQYLAALHLHEDGHRNHGIGAAQEVMKKLTLSPLAPSCKELGIAANKAAQQIIRHYNQQDVEYDRLTQHGLTQGAVFPVLSTGSR
jgi:predicted secreted Zn-dependent protease